MERGYVKAKTSAGVDKKRFSIGKALFFIAAACAAWIIMSTETSDIGDESVMPIFEDVTAANRVYIETVYDNGLMMPGGDGDFGVDSYLSVSEAAFIAVRLYEDANSIPHSYDTYYTMQDAYINKALEYGILPELSSTGEEPLTREGAAAILSQFVQEGGAGYTKLKSIENYTYRDAILKLYNLGITLDKNASAAYSPDIAITRGEMAQLVTMLLNPDTRKSISMPDYDGLENMLSGMLSGYDGDWSLYFEDYETGETISINSHQVFSASLIKLFVIQTVYQRIHDGIMSDSSETEELLRKMITYSDNDAWYSLTRKISGSTHSAGMAIVTDTAEKTGFMDTGTFYLGHQGNYNYTSVNDCGRYLHMILNGEIVSPEYSAKILDLLSQQQIRYKIPAGVPEAVEVANKTGELDYMQGDAAIVYAPFGTYILTVIGDDLKDTGTAQLQIREISKAVYDFLNK